jgi:hypothetical protein
MGKRIQKGMLADVTAISTITYQQIKLQDEDPE